MNPPDLARIALAALLASSAIAAAVLNGVAWAEHRDAPSAATVRDVCGAPKPGYVRCLARLRTDVRGGRGIRGSAARRASELPAGFGPADLRAAYSLPTVGGAGQTIAIVDAGDDPTAEADLAVYRATYGLPPCTTENGCFRKVNQRGQVSPLPPDAGWSVEIALDLDLASAACPSCHLLLVEADDPSLEAIAASVNTAAALGATEISNSYGTTEFNGVEAFAASYRHPGVAVIASSGDSGFTIPSIPAAYTSVISVGGTSLSRSTSARGWAETAWAGAGSGCSAWIAKPAWQHDPNCPGRTVADLAAVADPKTGLAAYTTTDADGWIVVGGTSASAPFIAGVIALAGNPRQHGDASYLYSHATALRDVVGGSNASPEMECGGDYLCTALPGYDGPTGLGTPNGLGAF